MDNALLFSIFLVFASAALAATAALFTRQSLLVAYIVVGLVLGPSAAGLVTRPELIQQIGSSGVIFLLFLLGLNLHPHKLVTMFSEAMLTTLVSTLVFGAYGFLIGYLLDYGLAASGLFAAAAAFSSTIIGLKLLPATELHHHHAGEVIIAILLLQDLLAILVLLMLQGYGHGPQGLPAVGMGLTALVGLVAATWLLERWVLRYLFSRFDAIGEYVFLLAVGWCVGVAQLAESAGLSYEIGAFVAGVALANSPISRFIAESLRPLRDFFLIMFFFALGAGLRIDMLGTVLWPALALAGGVLILKPLIFWLMLRRAGEQEGLAREVGLRLGQMSEFSLFIAVVATQTQAVSAEAGYVVQLATVVTFLVSSYLIGSRLPTPIAASARLRRD